MHVEESGLAIIASAGQAVRYLSLIALLAIAPCIEGPPILEASVEVAVDLPPGATETYEFEIEVDVIGNDDLAFRVVLDPTPELLASQGITLERWWVNDGVEQAGWPTDGVIVEGGQRMTGELIMTLSNDTDSRIEQEMTVIITESGGPTPGPGEDELKLTIKQR